MKLTIFGATGRIGGHLLSWAVDAGHDVHVLARSPQALRPRDGLTVTGGDVLDPAAVAAVIFEADAVLSAVGPKILDNFRKTELLAPAAANFIDGMHKTGAHRLIAVSAAAAFVTEDPDKSWIVKQIQPRIFARVFADVRQMERVVKDSDLDWTLVRPTRLVSDPGRAGTGCGPTSRRPAAARSPVLTWRTSSAPRSPRPGTSASRRPSPTDSRHRPGSAPGPQRRCRFEAGRRARHRHRSW